MKKHKSIISVEEKMYQLFWAKVNIGRADECWLWNGNIDRNGFGRFSFEGKILMSHRVAYMLKHKAAIRKTTIVLQTCGNKVCCNPAHLDASTWKDKLESMAGEKRIRGYAQRGEDNTQATLTEEIVLKIRSMYKRGIFGVTRVSKALGIPKSTVGDVARNKWWKWLKKD